MRRLPNLGRLAISAIAFLGGFGSCLFAPDLINLVFSFHFGSNQVEQVRVRSPNGQFDAVLVGELWGGAAGGIDWCVYIVPKGQRAPSHAKGSLFHASTLQGETLVWNQPHLLEIRYDLASVDDFRNLWAAHEVEDVGSHGENDYFVEVHLTPSSDFSLLTPEGDFRCFR